MTYGIVATSPSAVNALKRRPPDQNIAVAMHADAEWQTVAPSLDVPSNLLPRIVALMVWVTVRVEGAGAGVARAARRRGRSCASNARSYRGA
jgi:hypothetical protein